MRRPRRSPAAPADAAPTFPDPILAGLAFAARAASGDATAAADAVVHPGAGDAASVPLATPEHQLGRLRRYQRILLDFSRMTAESGDVPRLLQLAAVQSARGVGIAHSKVMRHRPETGDLLMVAGIGWRPGVVGRTSLGADLGSAPGQALHTRQPVVTLDLPNDPEVRYSRVLRDHGIVSALNVPVVADGAVWGVLEVDSDTPRHFGQDDADFLLSMANILGLALDSRSRLHQAIREATDANATLASHKTLLRELQHRNRNDLQLILSLLVLQKRRVTDDAARRGLAHVMDRVAAIGVAHDQLSVGHGKGWVGLADYLRALCGNLQQRQEGVRVETELAHLEMPHERAVPLGLIVNELVTNALKHAFPHGRPGTVRVTCAAGREGEGVLRVWDDGVGMGPPRPGSSGTELVRLLVQQVGGHMEQEARDRGVGFQIRFPLVT